MESFKRFSQIKYPIMISLKPLKELIKYKNDLIEYLKNITSYYVYGGFIFRCIIKENELLELIISRAPTYMRVIMFQMRLIV